MILDADVSWASDCDVSVVAPGFEAAAAVPSFLAVREVYLRGILRHVEGALKEALLAVIN